MQLTHGALCLQAVKFKATSVHGLLGVAESYKKLTMIDEAIQYYERAHQVAVSLGLEKMKAFITYGLCDALLAQVSTQYLWITSGILTPVS